MHFNDLSSPAALLATRRSGKARDMIAPGPDAAQLDAVLAAAMRVPDHGKLAPWRLVVVDADRRDAFAALLTRAYRAEKPTAGRLEIETMESFARQAPCLIALLSTPVQPHKIPLWEQQLSAGAVAMQLLNAAHAHGFVGNWLTGWPANSADILASLGGSGPEDRIVGFFFIGTPAHELEERPRPDPASVIRHWRG
jgi:nitroreductase